jgi:hypothetical protein
LGAGSTLQTQTVIPWTLTVLLLLLLQWDGVVGRWQYTADTDCDTMDTDSVVVVVVVVIVGRSGWALAVHCRHRL